MNFDFKTWFQNNKTMAMVIAVVIVLLIWMKKKGKLKNKGRRRRARKTIVRIVRSGYGRMRGMMRRRR